MNSVVNKYYWAISIVFILYYVFLVMINDNEPILAIPLSYKIIFITEKTLFLMVFYMFYKIMQNAAFYFNFVPLSICIMRFINEWLYILNLADINNQKILFFEFLITIFFTIILWLTTLKKS